MLNFNDKNKFVNQNMMQYVKELTNNYAKKLVDIQEKSLSMSKLRVSDLVKYNNKTNEFSIINKCDKINCCYILLFLPFVSLFSFCLGYNLRKLTMTKC